MQPEDYKELAEVEQRARSNTRRIEALETGQREPGNWWSTWPGWPQNMRPWPRPRPDARAPGGHRAQTRQAPGEIITAIIAALAGAVITAVAAGLLSH